MKIRKLLSSLVATTLLATMVSAFTVVKAAETPVITADTYYDSENACIILELNYSGFENFVAYSKKIGKENVRGLSTIQGVVTVDAKDASKLVGETPAIEYWGADTGNLSMSINRDATTAADVFSYKMGFLATAKAQYDVNESNNIAVFYFGAAEDETITFNLSDITLIVEETVSNVASPSLIYSVANGNLECPASVTYGSEEEEPELPSNTITVSKVISDRVGDAVRENMITWGLAAVCDVDGAPTAETITFNITAADEVNGTATKAFTYDLGVDDWSKIDAKFVFGLNIKGVPATGATITCEVADVTIQ